MGRTGDTEADKKLKASRKKRAAEFIDYEPPECPDWLSDEAKDVWARQAPARIKLKKLSINNENEFAEYCDLIVALRDINKFINKENKSRIQITEWTNNQTGEIKEKLAESPYSKMKRDYATKLQLFRKQFEIKPSEMGASISSGDSGEDEDLFV